METSSAALPDGSPGDWLARQMERRGVGVRQLAHALDVTEKAIYEWRGNRTAISESRVPRLAEALGVSEIEARRGLGFWVPNGSEPAADVDLDAIEDLLQSALAELNRLKREREKPA